MTVKSSAWDHDFTKAFCRKANSISGEEDIDILFASDGQSYCSLQDK